MRDRMGELADYRLVRNGALLGTLTRTDGDFPWWNGEFDPKSEFEAVRPLFEQELALLNADETDAWGPVYDELAAGLALEPLDGRPTIMEFLLHIEGRSAWWRY